MNIHPTDKAFAIMLAIVVFGGATCTGFESWSSVERAKLEAARPCECGEGRK